ncbi:MAG: hypothetical protein LBH13_09575 [Cellulomonadaceae bacterium]|jgi:hypothetical protein|nr:hypothetical protein [Cellulomonadaceae bacterium]
MASGRDCHDAGVGGLAPGIDEFSPLFMPPVADDDSWWPSHIDSTDLPVFLGAEWKHVLLGDDTGGGHLWTVVSAGPCLKSAFPRHWGAALIGEAAALALRQHALQRGVLPAELPTEDFSHLVVVAGRRLVITVSLDHDPSGRCIITTYPLRGQGVEKWINGILSEVPLRPDET